MQCNCLAIGESGRHPMMRVRLKADGQIVKSSRRTRARCRASSIGERPPTLDSRSSSAPAALGSTQSRATRRGLCRGVRAPPAHASRVCARIGVPIEMCATGSRASARPRGAAPRSGNRQGADVALPSSAPPRRRWTTKFMPPPVPDAGAPRRSAPPSRRASRDRQ
jgi:hypothetical protein